MHICVDVLGRSLLGNPSFNAINRLKVTFSFSYSEWDKIL